EYGLAFFMHRHRKYSERAVTRPQQLIEETHVTTASPRSGLVQPSVTIKNHQGTTSPPISMRGE
ncbi:MAG: hypothetical protein AB7J34_24920, partial [Limisphaerales bacterium]